MQKENRNNRVHTGEQSGKTDFLIEGLLPVGKGECSHNTRSCKVVWMWISERTSATYSL